MLNPIRKQLLDATPSTTLALQSGQFLSRIFTDTSGQQFRLTFFVTIINGEAKGHLVSVQPISTSAHLRLAGECVSVQVFCLPCASQKVFPSLLLSIFPSAPSVSPFTELFFFTSQPTRAPSHN